MNIVKLTMGAVIAIVLIMVLVVPITGEMAKNTGTPTYSENSDYNYKMAYDTKSTANIVRTADGFTVNGTAVTSSYMIMTDTVTLQILAGSGSVTGANCLIKTGENTVQFMALAAMAEGTSLRFSGSSWTYTPASGSTVVTSAVTSPFSWVFYPDENGDYIRCSQPVKVDSSAKIAAFGFTSVTGHSVSYGTVSDLAVVYTSDGTNTAKVTYTADGYTNNVTDVTVIHSGSETSQGANLIVPLQYTSGMEDSITTTLVMIIPVLLIASLVIGIVIRVLNNRDK